MNGRSSREAAALAETASTRRKSETNKAGATSGSSFWARLQEELDFWG